MTRGGNITKYRGVQKFYGKNLYQAVQYRSGRFNEKGCHVYLGSFLKQEDAARAYDLFSLKLRGSQAKLNFPKSNYEEEVKILSEMSEAEILASIRRSRGQFAKGKSVYRGVAKYKSKKHGEKWVVVKAGNGRALSSSRKFYDTKEEAAMAYDIETIKLKGERAVINFSIRLYDIESIMNGSMIMKINQENAWSFKVETQRLWQPLMNKFRRGGSSAFQEQHMATASGSGLDLNSILISSSDSGSETDSDLGHPVSDGHGDDRGGSGSSSRGSFRHSNDSAFKPYVRN